MDQQQAVKLKQELLHEKAEIEGQLGQIAKKNPAIKGDWTAVPADVTNPADSLDEKAQNVTNYEERRALEQNFELRLREIDETLERLDKGTYGICSNCNLQIGEKRLQAIRAAQLCINCASNTSLT